MLQCSVLQCVAACCSELQCVAVCCSALQCVAKVDEYKMEQGIDRGETEEIYSCVAVCCSVLQCVVA